MVSVLLIFLISPWESVEGKVGLCMHSILFCSNMMTMKWFPNHFNNMQSLLYVPVIILQLETWRKRFQVIQVFYCFMNKEFSCWFEIY